MHTPDILRCHPYTTNFFLFLSSAAQTRLPITFMGSLLPCVCACACALGHLQFRHVADALQDELRYKQHYEFKMKIYDQKHFFVPWPPQRIKKNLLCAFLTTAQNIWLSISVTLIKMTGKTKTARETSFLSCVHSIRHFCRDREKLKA